MMKGTILVSKKNLPFSKDIVKHLSQVIRRRLPANITIAAVSEKESRRLNRTYQGKDKETNVLSFLYGKEYGEIIVCPAVIRAEAKAQGHSFHHQMTWMIVHGMLHLAGVHHENSLKAEARFCRIERNILQKALKKS